MLRTPRKSAPPLGRRFQPGQSGNPGGRPKTIIAVAELARQYTTEAIEMLVRSCATGRRRHPLGLAPRRSCSNSRKDPCAVRDHRRRRQARCDNGDARRHVARTRGRSGRDPRLSRAARIDPLKGTCLASSDHHSPFSPYPIATCVTGPKMLRQGSSTASDFHELAR